MRRPQSAGGTYRWLAQAVVRLCCAFMLLSATAGCGDAECVPSAERCDGRDDDCDGSVDETFPLGQSCSVGVGQCSDQGVLGCLDDGSGVHCLASPGAPSLEVCDGRDNDCDGGVDEVGDLTLAAEIGVACGGGGEACPAGRVVCRAGRLECLGGQTPSPERCDGVDNDCDGRTDEAEDLAAAGLVGQPCGSEKGACEGDRTACVEGALICLSVVRPMPETCDGADNDCDGQTDEEVDLVAAGVVGSVCGVGEGACRLGVTECSEGGILCVGAVGPGVEVCDGIDNDCDGALDEAEEGDPTDCGSATGVCRRGILRCVAGAPVCDGEIVGVAEVCDGQDNDCDGVADEAADLREAGETGRACGSDRGLCRPGVMRCVEGSSVCDGGTAPAEEVCDGADNDCDGQTDETADLAARGWVGRSCGSSVGVCVAGVSACIEGELSCEGQTGPSDEVCDSLDDDCDGQTDEGFEGLGRRCDRQGACQIGAWVCRADGAAICCSAEPTCEPDRVVGDELCDHLDNDCDGEVDEHLQYEGLALGAPCVGQGVCGAGMVVCLNVLTVGCSSGPGGADFNGGEEVCNAVDDDCDGVVNEGFRYAGVEIGAECGDVGRCGPGVVECADAEEAQPRCSTMPGGSADGSRPEVCDGLDDDCDGSVDEGLTLDGAELGEVCRGIGECPDGVVQCAEGVVVCSTGPGGLDDRSSPERCGEGDDDCDGSVDEGWTYQGRGVGELCEGVGRCALGRVECPQDGSAARCSTNPGGSAHQDRRERCDGQDDDCDGAVDEGFEALGDPCDGQDADLCVGGVQICAADGQGLTCDGDDGPGILDLCDGVDNDCDGVVDEATPALVAGCVGARRHVATDCVRGRCEASCLAGFADDNGDLDDPTGNGCEAYSGPTFTDVTVEAGLSYVQFDRFALGICTLNGHCVEEFMTGGAAAGDYNGDGRVDLYVTRIHGRDILFRNRGDGTFNDVALQAGLVENMQTNGAVFCDLDNDGDQDLYVTTMGEDRFLLYMNNGGVFTEEGRLRGAAVDDPQVRSGFSVACGDYDRDGWADLHVTENRLVDMDDPRATGHTRLLRNRGAAQPAFFDDVTEAAGVSMDIPGEPANAFTSTFTDLDADGWPDLAIVSDFGTSRLFWNQGDGSFLDGTVAAGVGLDDNGMGSAVGDFDGDGRLDWFVSAIYEFAFCDVPPCPLLRTGNKMYRNEGGRRFSEHAERLGVQSADWGWGTTFFDYDNDGDLDLVVTDGANAEQWDGDPMRLWRSDGGTMSDVAQEAGLTDTGDGKGLLVFDYDNDGDLDVFVVRNEDTPRLYRNNGVETGSVGGWLRVRLRGTSSTAEGLGARVTLHPSDGGPTQLREMRAGSNYLSQNEATLHFGLGESGVDHLEIVWPGAAQAQIVRNVVRNTTVVVTEP